MKKIIIVSFHWVEKYEYTTYTYLVTEKKKIEGQTTQEKVNSARIWMEA